MRIRKFGPAALIPFVVCGCASPPANLRGDYAEVTPAQGSDRRWQGSDVRWGGVVVGARLTDAGECAEIAQFPLDRFTFRPYRIFPGGSDGLLQGLVATDNSSRAEAAPRFLACPGHALNSDTSRVGTVVTVVGTLQAASVFEVNGRNCVNSHQVEVSAVPDYSGTMHATGQNACFVSLPTVTVAASRVWPEGPSQHFVSIR